MPNACKSNGQPSGCQWRTAEEHVRIYPPVGNNAPKGVLRPHTLARGKPRAPEEERAAHQVVGGVKAHQADDGSLVCEDDQPDWDCDTAQTPTGGSSKESSALGESLTEQRRVKDDGLRVVNFFEVGRNGRYHQNKPRLTLCQQPR